MRDAIEAKREATLNIALRPDIAADEINRRLTRPRGKQSLSTFLRKVLNLSPVEIGLLQEAAGGKLATLAPVEIAQLVNAISIRLAGTAPMTRAISTAGGISFDAIDERIHAARAAGRVRGRRNARLGGADRRLSAAGVLCDRCTAANGALRWLDHRNG